jgi:hypothetical protein
VAMASVCCYMVLNATLVDIVFNLSLRNSVRSEFNIVDVDVLW